MSDRVFNVLFLCTHNSARSVMAEGILNSIGRGRFRAFSAGSHPRGAVHPYALDQLRCREHDVSGLHSKSWDDFSGPDAPPLDFVFTVCDNAANEVCPVWPGQPMTAHWGVADPSSPAVKDIDRRFAFAETYRMLRHRIELLVSLPTASLDRVSLQRKLDAIGRSLPAREKA